MIIIFIICVYLLSINWTSYKNCFNFIYVITNITHIFICIIFQLFFRRKTQTTRAAFHRLNRLSQTSCCQHYMNPSSILHHTQRLETRQNPMKKKTTMMTTSWTSIYSIIVINCNSNICKCLFPFLKKLNVILFTRAKEKKAVWGY